MRLIFKRVQLSNNFIKFQNQTCVFRSKARPRIGRILKIFTLKAEHAYLLKLINYSEICKHTYTRSERHTRGNKVVMFSVLFLHDSTVFVMQATRTWKRKSLQRGALKFCICFRRRRCENVPGNARTKSKSTRKCCKLCKVLIKTFTIKKSVADTYAVNFFSLKI